MPTCKRMQLPLFCMWAQKRADCYRGVQVKQVKYLLYTHIWLLRWNRPTLYKFTFRARKKKSQPTGYLQVCSAWEEILNYWRRNEVLSVTCLLPLFFSLIRKHHISARTTFSRTPGLQHLQVCSFLKSNEWLEEPDWWLEEQSSDLGIIPSAEAPRAANASKGMVNELANCIALLKKNAWHRSLRRSLILSGRQETWPHTEHSKGIEVNNYWARRLIIRSAANLVASKRLQSGRNSLNHFLCFSAVSFLQKITSLFKLKPFHS